MTHSGSRLSTAALKALCPLVLYAVVRDQWACLAADSCVSQREVVPSWMVGQPGTLQTRNVVPRYAVGHPLPVGVSVGGSAVDLVCPRDSGMVYPNNRQTLAEKRSNAKWRCEHGHFLDRPGEVPVERSS